MIAAAASIGLLALLIGGIFTMWLCYGSVAMPRTFESDGGFRAILNMGPMLKDKPKEIHGVEHGKLIKGRLKDAYHVDQKMKEFANNDSKTTTKTGTSYELDIQLMRLATKTYRPTGLNIDIKTMDFTNADESNWHELQQICKVWSEILKVPAEFGVFANSDEVPEFLNTQALSDVSNVLTNTEGTANRKIVEKTLTDCLGEDEARQMEDRIHSSMRSMIGTERMEEEMERFGLTRSKILAELSKEEEEGMKAEAEAELKKRGQKKKSQKKKKSKKRKSQKKRDNKETVAQASQKKRDSLKEKFTSNRAKSDKESPIPGKEEANVEGKNKAESDKESPISGREKSSEQGKNEAKSDKGSSISRKEKSTGQGKDTQDSGYV